MNDDDADIKHLKEYAGARVSRETPPLPPVRENPPEPSLPHEPPAIGSEWINTENNHTYRVLGTASTESSKGCWQDHVLHALDSGGKILSRSFDRFYSRFKRKEKV